MGPTVRLFLSNMSTWRRSDSWEELLEQAAKSLRADDDVLARLRLAHADAEAPSLPVPPAVRAWFAARALALYAVSEATKLPYDAINIHRTSLGKPFLEPAYSLEFSVSHTAAWVAAATCRHCKVGTDIVPLADLDGDVSFLLPHFTPQERCFLDTLPRDKRVAYAAQLWSVKECILKILGCGLTSKEILPTAIECSSPLKADDVGFGRSGSPVTTQLRPLTVILKGEKAVRWSYSTFITSADVPSVVTVVVAEAGGGPAEASLLQKEQVLKTSREARS